MNEQRQQAYLNLINQLLSCNEGDELQILQENQGLLDWDLIEIMVVLAQQYGEAGRETEEQLLMSIAQQLAAELGLLEEEKTETTNASQNYLKFLIEVLQQVAHNPNSQLIYSFLELNIDKLDENLITILDNWARKTLSSVSSEIAYDIASYLFTFNNLIQQFPLGNVAINQEIAIVGYEAVLIIFTFDNFPRNWADTKNSLAVVYSNRIKGDKAENLEQAISYFQESLKFYTFNTFPYEWSILKNNLVNAYRDRIKGDRAENLEQAISAGEQALKVRTFEAFPHDWAMSQNNLSTAYLYRIKGDKAENLEKAISAGEQALKVYNFEAFPHEWAILKYNLALAYSDRIRGDKAENLEQAIAYFQESLKVRTFEAFPHDWAMTQHKFATTYCDRIRGDKAENLEQAIAYFQESLKVITFNTFPYDWADIQNNLGNAYSDRIRGDKAENLEQAIAYFQESLKIRTFEDFPIDWAVTQNNLGNAYKNRIRGDKADNLEQAIIYFQESLKIYTFEDFPNDWAMSQNNLAGAYRNRVRGDKTDNLEKAISLYQETLKLLTLDAIPINWAMTQNNLAIAYSNRIRGNQADNLEQAIICYQEALKVRTFEDFPIDWAITQNNLATAYLCRIRGDKADNLEQAIVCCQEALKVRTFEDFPIDWAITQNNLATIYRHRIRGNQANNLEKAISSYHNTLQISTKEDDPLNCLLAARNLADLYYGEKQWQPATEAYLLAIEALENTRLEGLNPQNRQETLSNAIDIFHRVVQAHLNLNQPEKALEYVERSKARNLVELMANKNIEPQGVSQAILDKLSELKQRVVNEQIRLQNQVNKYNISRNDSLNPYVSDYSHLKEYQQKLDEFIEQEITPIDPSFKLTQKVESISFDEIQALINPETSLVEWYVTNERILAFIITSDSLKVWQSTSEDLQKLLDWKDEYLEAYQQNKTQWIKTLDSHLNQLSTILHLDEVLDLIPQTCNQLILIPHYFLHIFPLHTLPLKNGKFLYECFSQGVGYAPSCQLLQLVQERKAERIEEFNQIFAIQNPTRRDTKPLLGANLEIARISQYFAPQNSTIIAESEASETKLVELQDKIKSTHCLHFSCHGKFNAQSPLESALFLADSEGNLGESANLTLAEIFEKLDLQQCRLVTLSACESGVVDPTVISDEYIGIPSGFLFAGSLSVVSTLWTVDPLATTLFMTKFYRYLKKASNPNELNVTIAANKAQTWLRNLSSQKLARIKNSLQFQQLLKEVFLNQKRDYMKFQDLLEAAVKRQPYPFANPYYWTAFTATGL